MKCPKCGFNSFEFHDTCRKCGKDLAAFKASFNIRPLVYPRKKGEPDEPLLAGADEVGGAAAPTVAPAQVAAPLPLPLQDAPPVFAPDDFVFESTPLEPVPDEAALPVAPLPRERAAAEELPPQKVTAPVEPVQSGAAIQQEAPKGEFSIDDFIHFAELNGKGKGGESTHSFGKGGFDLEDLFPPDQAEVAAEPPAPQAPSQGQPEEPEDKAKELDWLE